MNTGKSKRISNTTKATTTGAAAGVLLPWAAYVASQKWQVPIEVSSAAISLVAAYLGRWAAKLDPQG